MSYSKFSSIPIALDSEDPVTWDVIARYAPKLAGKTINAEKSRGMRLRNIQTAIEGMAHIKDAGAKVYVYQGGMHHLFGHKDRSFRYHDSLVARFKAQGAAVLPVFFVSPPCGVDIIPPEALKALAGSIVITGVASDKFLYNSIGEANHIRALAEQSGTEFPVFDAKELQASRAGMRRWVKKEASHWITDSGASSKAFEPA
jgi:hypothetical protein